MMFWRLAVKHKSKSLGTDKLNMRHRNHRAGVLGRFISRDPIGHRGGLNLYSYPTNPVSFVDPSGLTCKITGSAADQKVVIDLLEAATGYDLSVGSNGNLSINQASGINFSGTSGSARQLISQMINSSTTTTIRATDSATFQSQNPHLDVGQAGPGVFGRNEQSILTDNLQQIASQNSTLAQGNLIHEFAEAYAQAKSQAGYKPCHQNAITAENNFFQDVDPSILRGGFVALRDQNGNVYGVAVDYGSLKLQQIDASKRGATFQVYRR